jgi:hypothetical protein
MPQAGRAGDVEHAGFVFEVDERNAAGGGRALAVGDDPADQDAGLVGHVGEAGDGVGAEPVEVRAGEGDGVGFRG